MQEIYRGSAHADINSPDRQLREIPRPHISEVGLLIDTDAVIVDDAILLAWRHRGKSDEKRFYVVADHSIPLSIERFGSQVRTHYSHVPTDEVRSFAVHLSQNVSRVYVGDTYCLTFKPVGTPDGDGMIFRIQSRNPMVVEGVDGTGPLQILRNVLSERTARTGDPS